MLSTATKTKTLRQKLAVTVGRKAMYVPFFQTIAWRGNPPLGCRGGRRI